MNEKEIAARFRELDDGSEPDAPVGLRRYVRDLEFTSGAAVAGARRRPTLARLVAAGLAAALVLGVGAGGLWLSTTGPIASQSPRATALDSRTPIVIPTDGLPSTKPSATQWDPYPIWWESIGWDPSTDGPYRPSWADGDDNGYFGGCFKGFVSPSEGPVGVYCTSPDGLHWTPSTNPMWKGVQVTSVAHGATAWVMAGHQGLKAVFFRSPDRVNWTRVPDSNVAQQDLSITLPSGQKTHGLTPAYRVAAGPGGFVAVGWNNDWMGGPLDIPTVVWTSADGSHWTSRVSPAAADGFVFNSGGRFFLTGRPTDADPFPLWYSDDGATWAKSTTDADTTGLIELFAVIKYWDGSDVAVADSQTGGRDFYSKDGGVSWHDGGVSRCSGLSFYARATGMMVETSFDGSSGTAVYTTSISLDDGRSWQTVADSGQPHGGDWISMGNAVLMINNRDPAGIDQSSMWVGRQFVRAGVGT
jgi:hypothetical protein